MNSSRTRLQYRIQHMVFIILLLSLLGFVGWLSIEFDQSSDWTHGARHSLSQDTIEILQQMNGEINLRTYQADDPTLLNAIREILQRYQRNKIDFEFEMINPDIYIAQAKRDNISQYGQTIIDYAGKSERIDQLSEESITNALLRLQRGNRPQIMFLSQHGERSIDDGSAQGYSLLKQQLNQKGFDAISINLLQHNLDTSNSVLVLNSIKRPLLQSEQDTLMKYLEEGGNLLWLQDPAPDQSQQPLADMLALRFTPGIIVEQNEKISRMLKLPHPAVIPVLEYRVHPITHKMQYFTLFTTATALIPNESSDWIHSDLLITSDGSWSETGDFMPTVEYNKGADIPGPHSIGIALQRQIKRDQLNTAQRVVVIGDSDFASNHYLGQGANLEFIVKTLNWLSEDDNLISINPKDAPDRELALTPLHAGFISIFFLFITPLLLLSLGGWIWHSRRKN